MRSRAARLISTAIACLVIGSAAVFIFSTEQRIDRARTTLRDFDRHARDATRQIADARAGQQAYVAAGQSLPFWVPKVAALLPEMTGTVDTLRGLAASGEGRQALLDASATLTAFGNVDQRAREYLRADQPLMAGDVVFSEGAEAAAATAQHLETARSAELNAFDLFESTQRRLEAYAAGGAAGITALILLLLSAPKAQPRNEAAASDAVPVARVSASTELPQREESRQDAPPALAAEDDAPDAGMAALHAAADLCTQFGRVQRLPDVVELLGRAARAMDAAGVVVWLGNTSGGDMRAVVAHGYSNQVLELMRPIPIHADNAAAAAYRSAALQIVASKPGTSLGAVVVPLMAPDGCIGAFTAEIRNNGEVSETVHALAAICAAQLSGILASSTQAADEASPRTATA